MFESVKQMDQAFSYIMATGLGLLLAHFISRPPELRSMRLSQLVFVPLMFDASVACSGIGGMAGFILFLIPLGVLIILLVPNLAYFCGVAVSSLVDPQDWTSDEEEIALKPIRKLIERDNFRQALGELDALLLTHKPTYEAILTRARLLNHIGRIDEAETALLSLIGLSNNGPQQVTVMQMLDFIDQHRTTDREAPLLSGIGSRPIDISHDLVLFQNAGEDTRLRKEIPPGTYQVEEIIHGQRRWLKLAGEDWANDERCWEAVRATLGVVPAPPKDNTIRGIARLHQRMAGLFKGKLRRHVIAESNQLLQQANEFIRRGDWPGALPLLEKAAKGDPDKYEIAYRWLQAIRQTSDDDATEKAVNKILRQSQWSEDEQQMLKQLARQR